MFICFLGRSLCRHSDGILLQASHSGDARREQSLPLLKDQGSSRSWAHCRSTWIIKNHAWNYGLLVLVSYFIWDPIKRLQRSLTKKHYLTILPNNAAVMLFLVVIPHLQWKLFALPFCEKTQRFSLPEDLFKSRWILRSMRDLYRLGWVSPYSLEPSCDVHSEPHRRP